MTGWKPIPRETLHREKTSRRSESGGGGPDPDASGLFADFHALRHTCITNLARNGVPLATAQKLARHSTPVLTAQRYTHFDLNDQNLAVDQLPKLQRQSQGADAFRCPSVAKNSIKKEGSLKAKSPAFPLTNKENSKLSKRRGREASPPVSATHGQ